MEPCRAVHLPQVQACCLEAAGSGVGRAGQLHDQSPGGGGMVRGVWLAYALLVERTGGHRPEGC